MRNYIKTVLLLGILYFLAIIAFAVFTGRNNSEIPGRDEDIIKLNDITGDAASCWNDLNELGRKDYGTRFAVLDTADKVLYTSDAEGKEDLTLASAVKKGYLYSCVTVNDKLQGYVILPGDGHGIWRYIRIRIIAGLVIIGVLLLLSAVLFGRHINKSILIPFNNMKSFAGSIAEGKLDIPLEMDRNNMFGAFTESFDIMREELAESKKREIALQKRERELVASLSHDLKTPITGIKLTCELLDAKLQAMSAAGDAGTVPSSQKETDEIASPSQFMDDVAEKIGNIYKKADQIDVLVSDLFSSAMEELDELKVHCTDESSKVLCDIISRYDDRKLVSSGDIPEVLIHVDVKRLSQVIGNIISNSYKYAGTKIDVSYKLVDDYLEMSLKDHGPGVPEEELNLITNKFYRGKQWVQSKEEGSGLGLYIARMLMEKMDGELLPSCDGHGLKITLMIPLS